MSHDAEHCEGCRSGAQGGDTFCRLCGACLTSGPSRTSANGHRSGEALRRASADSFWANPSLDELAAAQGIRPIAHPAELVLASWNEDDEDEFLATIRAWRDAG